MAKSAQARLTEKMWDEKYGGMSEKGLSDYVRDSISKKLHERALRSEEKQREYEAKYNLPYGGLVKAVAKSAKQIKELENKPENLRNAKRVELEKEFDNLVEQGMFSVGDVVSREMYIDRKLLQYMSTPEYIGVTEQLQQARNDLAIFVAKKEEWEQDNADIIEAERIRTKRAELMQADPEALRALGIEPEAVSTPVAGSKADDGKGALREALRSIHPSATDAEIENMVKLV